VAPAAKLAFGRFWSEFSVWKGLTFDERRASAESGALPIAACCGFGRQTNWDQRGNVNGAESEASSVAKKLP
jgi:hypothetical protein